MLNYNIKELAIYPIKSCAGIVMPEVELTASGFKHDREFMLTGSKGRFLSQRQYPQMATIKTSFKNGVLWVSKRGFPDLKIPLLRKLKQIRVKIWEDELLAFKYPPEFSKWFTKALGVECHLVKMPRGNRVAKRKYTDNKKISIAFVDGYPVHIINAASVNWVTEKSGEKIPHNRYRANIVFSGSYAFEEDHIAQIQIGRAVLELVKTTYRCAITQTDQDTGEKYKQPLAFLSDKSSTRRTWNGAAFGQYALVIQPGKIRKSDTIEILKQK